MRWWASIIAAVVFASGLAAQYIEYVPPAGAGGGGDVTEVQPGLALDVTSGTGPIPVLAFDPTELLGSRTWGDGSTDTIVWTFDRSTGTDPTITFNSGSIGLQALTLATPLASTQGGTGLTALGTGVATALGLNVGSAGAPVLFDGALGTPSSGTVTNLTGTASININGTVGGTTPAAGTFTAVIANSFTPNLSTVPTNGMYLPAANTPGWAVNSAAEMQLTATALSPAADGGNSFGTTALGWQNLFGNTGFVLNIENSDWVATHTTGILTVGTGDLRVTTVGTNTASVMTVGGTQAPTNKTFDASATGNVIKLWGYLMFPPQPHSFGAGATQQTTATSPLYGRAQFAAGTDEATNYGEYYFTWPLDMDTAVDLTATFAFVLGAADTADHDYVLSMASIAASADKDGTLTNAINLAYTADASGASDDRETTDETTLTSWRTSITPGQGAVVRCARDGDDGTNDASTQVSYSGTLVIKYAIIQ